MSLPRVLYYFCFVIIAASLKNVKAVTEEEIGKALTDSLPMIQECASQHGTSADNIIEAKKKGNFKDFDTCIFACILKKLEIMDGSGKLQSDKVIALGKKYLHSEDDVKDMERVTNICEAVNDKDVSDGEKGCDRAKLLGECILENKGGIKFPF